VKRLLGNLALLLGSTVAMLLVAEGALRLLGFPPSFRVSDDTIGYRLRPNARYRWADEGFSEGHINAAGWRDRDYPEARSAGTTRILFCGDSYVEGLQVPLDSTFHKRLERRLNAGAAGHRFEVMAMGEGGAGTTQEYLMYRNWGARYDPDIVAVLFVLNDPGDNWLRDAADSGRPYFVEDGDSLRLDFSFASAPGYRRRKEHEWLKLDSSLLTLAAKVRLDLRARFRPTAAQAGLVAPHGWYAAWNLYVPPEADSIPAFRLTARILGRFAVDVRRDGRRFVVFSAGMSEQQDRDELARLRGTSGFDPDKTDRWLASVGERYGFEVVPLTPAFRAACAAGGPSLWFGSTMRHGHWNAAGHALAADVMGDSLASRLPGLRAAASSPPR
jgi:hypothetical protein